MWHPLPKWRPNVSYVDVIDVIALHGITGSYFKSNLRKNLRENIPLLFVNYYHLSMRYLLICVLILLKLSDVTKKFINGVRDHQNLSDFKVKNVFKISRGGLIYVLKIEKLIRVCGACQALAANIFKIHINQFLCEIGRKNFKFSPTSLIDWLLGNETFF